MTSQEELQRISENAKRGISWKQPPGPPLKKTREQFLPVTEGNPLAIEPEQERNTLGVATPYGLVEFTSTQSAVPYACDIFHPLDCAKQVVGVASTVASSATKAAQDAAAAAAKAAAAAQAAATQRAAQVAAATAAAQRAAQAAAQKAAATAAANAAIAAKAAQQAAAQRAAQLAAQSAAQRTAAQNILTKVSQQQATQQATNLASRSLSTLAAAGNLMTAGFAGRTGQKVGEVAQTSISTRQTWTMPDGSKMDLPVGQSPGTFCMSSPASPVCKQKVSAAVVSETAAQKTARNIAGTASNLANAAASVTMRKVTSISDPMTQTISSFTGGFAKPKRIRYDSASIRAHLAATNPNFRSLDTSKQNAIVQQMMSELRSKVVKG